jgi:hypothetical protein
VTQNTRCRKQLGIRFDAADNNNTDGPTISDQEVRKRKSTLISSVSAKKQCKNSKKDKVVKSKQGKDSKRDKMDKSRQNRNTVSQNSSNQQTVRELTKNNSGDIPCLYCCETFDEDWIQCPQCQDWAHTACAGVDKDEQYFQCENCVGQ